MLIRKGLAVVVAIALATIGVQAANAAQTSPDGGAALPSLPSDVLPYSDHEVVEFLLFGTGELAEDNPELTNRLIPEPSDGDPEAIDQFVEAVLANDPEIHSTTVEPMFSGDPYAVEAGLWALQDNVLEVAEVNAKRMSAEVGTQCVITWLAVVGGVVVVFVAAVVGVGYLAVYLYQYAADDSSTQFGFEEIVAGIAGTLGR